MYKYLDKSNCNLIARCTYSHGKVNFESYEKYYKNNKDEKEIKK